MRRKNADDVEAQPAATGRITPADVQQVEFRLAFRGYNERDVDAFLDRITEDLSAYLDELERTRDGSPAAFAGTPMAADGGDVDEARREADAIRSRAREEAAAIVRRAHQDAAAITAGTGGAEGDMRAAVAPFLNTEREFLQSLGTLVQDHAEEIKQMVLALRARVADARPTPAPPSQGAAPPEQPAAPPGAASAAEIRQRMGEPERPPAPPADEPVVIDSATEPAYSSEGAPAEGRERSLRELFWGDD
jgi:DivIVA domain-containing protein